MSTTVPPGDSSSHAASPPLLLTDEEALHKAVLADYPALTTEALADLGEGAAALAPHVVEGAFVRAWDARARFHTPEALHDFLEEDVHHAAARALSRHAIAHRMGDHAPHAASAHDAAAAHHAAPAAVTAEDAWVRIQRALHRDAHRAQALEESAAVSRHEAAQHIGAVERGRPWWIPVALGVVFLLVLLGVVRWMDRAGTDRRLARAVDGPDTHVVSSTAAQIGVVPLDDGSSVRLAPESRLTIPNDFGADVRAVRLEAVMDLHRGGRLC